MSFDQPHQLQIDLALRHKAIVGIRPVELQQRALPGDRQTLSGPVTHLPALITPNQVEASRKNPVPQETRLSSRSFPHWKN